MPLEIVKLSKRYGNNWVLRDVYLSAAGGELLGVCGGTAAGKSTLLSAIAGHTKPSGFAMTLDSRDISATSAKDRAFSLLSASEAPGLLDIFAGWANKGSGGERQLAAFEELLTKAGKVLLLDDPFTQIDDELRQECLAKLRQAAADRIVIFASSDFRQVAAVADKAAILAGGSIVQTGTPQDIYDNPETLATARLTGDNNFFEARRLTSTDADLPEFHTIAGSHRIFAQSAPKSRLGAINQNVTLAIRPEQISMSMGASFPEDNLLRAVVTGIKFRGSTSLIAFDAAGLKLQTRVFKIVGLNIGDECMLGLPPERIVVLKN